MGGTAACQRAKAPNRFGVAVRAERGIWLALALAVLLSVVMTWKDTTRVSATLPLPSSQVAASSGAAAAASTLPAPTALGQLNASPKNLAQPAGKPPPTPKPRPDGGANSALASTKCPDDMVAVLADFCPMVAHRCARWLGSAPRRKTRSKAPADRRCQRFRNEAICEGRPSRLAYCIDRHEYPNLPGAKPVVLISFEQARQACQRANKRLCTRQEWIQACEGARRWPYPYGIVREHGVCNVDRLQARGEAAAWEQPQLVSLEVQRVDRRMPAGTMPRCRSPYGAMAMMGNVAEWVEDRRSVARRKGHRARIAGGHWGRVPATCRQLQLPGASKQKQVYLGFRCCADMNDGRAPRRLLGAGWRLPYRRPMLDPQQKQ